MHLNYSIDNADGYQNDPYKIISGLDSGGNVVGYIFESRPTKRTRNSIYWENKFAVGDEDVLNLSYRHMNDDWGIKSDTFDVTYRWQLVKAFYLEPHFRQYRQTAADFYALYLLENAPLVEYASSDPRLAALDGKTVGIKVGFMLDKRSELNLRFERYTQTGRDLPSAVPVQLEGLDFYPGLTTNIIQAGVHFEF